MYGASLLQDELLTRGVMLRRMVAWVIDIVFAALIAGALWGMFLVFGILTLGLGLHLLALVPLVPFLYNMLTLASPLSGTPGQRMMGLMVRRDDDLTRPTLVQAAISTLFFYVTLAATGLLLVIALFTRRHRTLHDIFSGLVVVRTQALTPPAGFWNMPAGT
jgi:uncharacterized RDD family membrane protein YckC